MPEKVPEKTPGEWLTKLSMTAPGCLCRSAGDEASTPLSVKVEAGSGLGGPEMEPVGAGEQTGVAACSGQLGCGHPEGKDGVEILGKDVSVERGGQD